MERGRLRLAVQLKTDVKEKQHKKTGICGNGTQTTVQKELVAGDFGIIKEKSRRERQYVGTNALMCA